MEKLCQRNLAFDQTILSQIVGICVSYVGLLNCESELGSFLSLKMYTLYYLNQSGQQAHCVIDNRSVLTLRLPGGGGVEPTPKGFSSITFDRHKL